MIDGGDFTLEEWDTVTAMPVVAAALISAVDYSAQSERKEIDTFARHFKRTAAKHKKSHLVQAVHATNTEDDLRVFRDVCNRIAAQQSGDTPIDDEMRRINNVVKLVDSRADESEAKAYKRFAYECAVLVARAHKESALPFANPISRTEDFYLRRLGRALGLRL